ncbi:reverse transcriptase [Plakobranchus ocellatus]|uniref:Reverse transcriptase n=1 Tax=Plakobranchus ocellatus TaxID=259542 RepID=A0AAV3ZUT7_9GAST|nr:reverse transcriptase [Plakobranchus ocellatus]
MTPEESKDYEIIKLKLLQRFNYDRNGFQDKFFAFIPQLDETFESCLYRSKRFLDGWISLAEVDSYSSLYFLILSDLVLSNCDSGDFVTFIKNRKPENVGDLVSHASTYKNSRPNKPFAKKVIQKVSFSVASGDQAPDRQFLNATNGLPMICLLGDHCVIFVTVSDIWPDSVLVNLLVPNVLSDLIQVATLLEQLMCVPIALGLGMPGKIVSSCETSPLKLF